MCLIATAAAGSVHSDRSPGSWGTEILSRPSSPDHDRYLRSTKLLSEGPLKEAEIWAVIWGAFS